jgi:hypothetical protein
MTHPAPPAAPAPHRWLKLQPASQVTNVAALMQQPVQQEKHACSKHAAAHGELCMTRVSTAVLLTAVAVVQDMPD